MDEGGGHCCSLASRGHCWTQDSSRDQPETSVSLFPRPCTDINFLVAPGRAGQKPTLPLSTAEYCCNAAINHDFTIYHRCKTIVAVLTADYRTPSTCQIGSICARLSKCPVGLISIGGFLMFREITATLLSKRFLC